MAEVRGFYSDKGVGALFSDLYFVDGQRTAFGKYTGALSTVSPTDLGIFSTKAVLESSGVRPEAVDQTIVANIGQSSADSLFLPRHIALYSGVPLEVPALMVQRVCGSGIEVIGQAAEQIAMGKAQVVLGVGTETMSLYPVASYGARQGFPLGRPQYIDFLWEALTDSAAVPMGRTADNIAAKMGLTRTAVDEFSLQSQERFFKAEREGFFKGEIVEVANRVFECEGLNSRKVKLNKTKSFSVDDNARETTLEKLSALPAIFSKEGPTTAGSASGIVDGACSVIVASQAAVESEGLKPMGRVLGVASAGLDPHYMGLGPVPAIQLLLSKMKLTVGEIDLFEINEAFGAQCLGCASLLNIDLAKLNVHGGAIALGHPLATTGTRLVTTLLRSLKQHGKKRGVASACIGGGQGIAMAVEVID
ncbi:thiolase family protein [Bdellovibrionales bacterium]|nr:thiolase family protein [Bdellovibrionales bacterium]